WDLVGMGMVRPDPQEERVTPATSQAHSTDVQAPPAEAGPGGGSGFVVVANRLPIRVDDSGDWSISPGGLVSAMLPVMSERGGTWVGWDGNVGGEDQRREFDGIGLSVLALSEAERSEY